MIEKRHVVSTMILCAVAIALVGCEARERPVDPPTAPGQVAPPPTGLAEAYLNVIKRKADAATCPSGPQPPRAWHAEFDATTPLTTDGRADITFDIEKGAQDASSNVSLGQKVLRFQQLSLDAGGRAFLFCEYEMDPVSAIVSRNFPVGLCAGFRDRCEPVTADFVDPYDAFAANGLPPERRSSTGPGTARFWGVADAAVPVWNIRAADYADSYRLMRLMLSRSLAQKKDFTIAQLLTTFPALGDESARKKLADRGSLKYQGDLLVSAAGKRLEAVVADVVLKQNVTFALAPTVRVQPLAQPNGVMLFSFLDRPAVVFETLPAAFGDLRRFEIVAIRLQAQASEIEMKDPFSERTLVLRSTYAKQPLTLTQAESAKKKDGAKWIQ